MNENIFIRELRKKAGLTQETVAKKLGIARTTYTTLESGQSELSLSEIKKLSELYQIAPGDIVVGKHMSSPAAMVREETLDFYDVEDSSGAEPRVSNPKINAVKLRNVLLYVLDRVGAKPNVGETVLYKLLYFIDFDYYEKTGRSITGLTYIKNHFGPTPAGQFTDITSAMISAGDLEIAETAYFAHTQKKYLPTVSPDLSTLTADEIKHIDAELYRLGSRSATELSEFSHKDMPWIAAKLHQVIDYQLAMYRTDATTVREQTDDL